MTASPPPRATLPPPPIGEDALRACFNRLERHIETRYGVPVRIEDVPNPFTGDLDGAEIHIDHAEDLAGAFFLLVHLFGHTVQWNLSARAREIGSRLAVGADEALLAELMAYEREAAGYSLGLLHSLGITELDGWLSDFSTCDLRYLAHYYRTGQKLPLASFWEDGAPRIAPRPVPDFQPVRWVARGDGLVV
jgi:hypothetical protein